MQNLSKSFYTIYYNVSHVSRTKGMGMAVNLVSCSNLNFMAAYLLIFGISTSIITLVF